MRDAVIAIDVAAGDTNGRVRRQEIEEDIQIDQNGTTIMVMEIFGIMAWPIRKPY